jgi:hypothetical protein
MFIVCYIVIDNVKFKAFMNKKKAEEFIDNNMNEWDNYYFGPLE